MVRVTREGREARGLALPAVLAASSMALSKAFLRFPLSSIGFAPFLLILLALVNPLLPLFTLTPAFIAPYSMLAAMAALSGSGNVSGR